MDIRTLEINMLLHRYDSFKVELEFKNQKLDVINNLFLKEITKNLDTIEAPEVVEVLKDDIKKEKDVDVNTESKDEPINESVENENDIIDDEVDRMPKNELPSDIKNIFRKIVIMTHPDKLKHDDPNRANKIKMYLEVQKSAQANKISNILLIAHKLGIDIDVDGDYSESLSIEIKNLELQLKNIEYTTSWVWYHTPNYQLKTIMIERLRETIRKQKLADKNNI